MLIEFCCCRLKFEVIFEVVFLMMNIMNQHPTKRRPDHDPALIFGKQHDEDRPRTSHGRVGVAARTPGKD
jgi:hypothetical protein